MSIPSTADVGATKKPNMYHIVGEAQLSRRKTVVSTSATKCDKICRLMRNEKLGVKRKLEGGCGLKPEMRAWRSTSATRR
jgi:hypothetical protein